MAKAAELMKTIPAVVVPAAYVAVYEEGGSLYVRTYTAEGAIFEEVAGPFTDPGVTPGDTPPFVRGATEGSLDGCSIALLVGDDLSVLDLEALDLVAVATTHRPAEGGGLSWATCVRAGSALFYECGVLTGLISGVPGTSIVGWLRSISVDGGTLVSIASGIPSPFAGSTSGTGMIAAEHVAPVSPTQFAICFIAEDDSPNLDLVAVQLVEEDGSFATVENRMTYDGVEGFGVGGAVVIGSTIGSGTTRTVLDSSGSYFFDDADTAYVAEALFDTLTGFTPLSCSLNRDGTVLVWSETGTSKIATWDGSHPIVDGDVEDGPTFAGDYDPEEGTETLLWVFGL